MQKKQEERPTHILVCNFTGSAGAELKKMSPTITTVFPEDALGKNQESAAGTWIVSAWAKRNETLFTDLSNQLPLLVTRKLKIFGDKRYTYDIRPFGSACRRPQTHPVVFQTLRSIWIF